MYKDQIFVLLGHNGAGKTTTISMLTGMIDFGTAGIGDPAADYACIINTYGESFLARVAKYDSRVEATLDRARFWAGTLELQWLLAGIRQNDPSWYTAHIGNARDVAPIGTP